mmetsp:Transcript_4325/g.13954  ORF Transcript_4325/g.13954 Transcript_4325/m.13954 type:complete len:382 (-) Transcript_4325:417-1562(-)
MEAGEAGEEPQRRGRVHRHEIFVPEDKELLSLEVAERVQQADGVHRAGGIHCRAAVVEALPQVRGELRGGQLAQPTDVEVEGAVAPLQRLQLVRHRRREVLDRFPVPAERKHRPLREGARHRVANQYDELDRLGPLCGARVDARHCVRVADVVWCEVHHARVELALRRPRQQRVRAVGVAPPAHFLEARRPHAPQRELPALGRARLGDARARRVRAAELRLRPCRSQAAANASPVGPLARGGAEDGAARRGAAGIAAAREAGLRGHGLRAHRAEPAHELRARGRPLAARTQQLSLPWPEEGEVPQRAARRVGPVQLEQIGPVRERVGRRAAAEEEELLPRRGLGPRVGEEGRESVPARARGPLLGPPAAYVDRAEGVLHAI